MADIVVTTDPKHGNPRLRTFTQEEKDRILDGHLAEVYQEKGIPFSPVDRQPPESRAQVWEQQVRDLDEVFAEAEKSMGSADAIKKFEAGYPDFIGLSRWYPRARRVEETKQKESWQKTLSERLDKLRGGGNVDVDFDFKDLAAKFRAIPGQAQNPFHVLNVDVDSDNWKLVVNDDIRMSCENLVSNAVTALGYPKGSEELNVWCMLLRQYYSDRQDFSIKCSHIRFFCEASAQYCEHLASELYAMRREREAAGLMAAGEAPSSPDVKEIAQQGAKNATIDRTTLANIFQIQGKVVSITFQNRIISPSLQLDKNLRRLQKLIVSYADQTFVSPVELDAALDGVPGSNNGTHEVSEKSAPRLGFQTSGRKTPEKEPQYMQTLKADLIDVQGQISAAEASDDQKVYDNLEARRLQIMQELKILFSNKKKDWTPEIKKVHRRLSTSLRRAISLIETVDQDLGQHFQRTLLPVDYPYCYKPIPAIEWTS